MFGRRSVLLAVLWFASLCAGAQGLQPSRTVYKCQEQGKTVYSDAPCLGAQKIDVTPTRGLNKSSGRELVGADVRREQQREQLADALKPVTGMNARQLDQAARRQKLSAAQQQECRRLDTQLPAAEATERSAAGSDQRRAAQVELLRLRKAYRAGGCD